MMPPGHQVTSRIVFVDMSAGPHNAERQAFIDGGKKLVAAAGQPQSIFDLEADPLENKNLLSDPGVRDPLLQRYKAFRRGLRSVAVRPAP
jgi:hypothetical protein